MTSLAAVAWERPEWAWALLLPAVALLLALRAPRARAVAAATAALWRAASAATGGARRARRPPASLAWLLAALVLGALALAGPRWRSASSPSIWTAVVDRSPSMYLPWTAADAAGAGLTRLERALELWRSASPDGRTTRWRTPGEADVVAAAPPEAWLRSPRAPRPAPDWPAHDAPRTAWLTDAAPSDPPHRAALVASGGEAVPGAVAWLGPRRELVWDGLELVERAATGASPALWVEPPPVAPVAAVARAWARARGLAEAPRDGPDVVLRVEGLAGAAAGARVELGRDGWRLDAQLAALPPEPGLDTWLRASDGAPVVGVAPGRVVVGLAQAGEPRGDAASWAVSWGRLLDRAVLPAPGSVELVERRAAGAQVVAAGEEPGPGAGARETTLEPALAAAAALCAALWVRRPPRRPRPTPTPGRGLPAGRPPRPRRSGA